MAYALSENQVRWFLARAERDAKDLRVPKEAVRALGSEARIVYRASKFGCRRAGVTGRDLECALMNLITGPLVVGRALKFDEDRLGFPLRMWQVERGITTQQIVNRADMLVIATHMLAVRYRDFIASANMEALEEQLIRVLTLAVSACAAHGYSVTRNYAPAIAHAG